MGLPQLRYEFKLGLSYRLPLWQVGTVPRGTAGSEGRQEGQRDKHSSIEVSRWNGLACVHGALVS